MDMPGMTPEADGGGSPDPLALMEADAHEQAAGHYGYFHFSLDTILLFEQWTTHSVGALVGSCFAAMLLAIVFELLKVGRSILYARAAEQQGYGGKKRPGWVSRTCNWYHIVQTLLEVIHVFLGYVIMLLFMTFNAALAIAILLGVGIGYFFFRAGTSRSQYEELN